MIKHIGITIHDPTEIKKFYQDLLGFTIDREFVLEKELNQKLFGFYEEVPVTLMSKGDAVLELSITKLPARYNYSHLCIQVDDRQTLIQKASQLNYQVITIEREQGMLVFIQDKFGNNFEIKHS